MKLPPKFMHQHQVKQVNSLASHRQQSRNLCSTSSITMAGVKRGRNDWDDIEDTEELKEILDRQHDQITKLKKENSELRSALRSQDSTPGQKSPEELAAQAAKSRASLSKNIENQMVYKKSLKGELVLPTSIFPASL